MRARLFWLARWLLGGDQYHRGPIEVTIGEGAGPGDRLTLAPKPGDEVYDGPAGPVAGERLAELAPRLLATFLSKDGREVLALVAARGRIASKAIAAAVGVERSKCYGLIADLRERGLIRDGADGYELAAPEVWAAVARVEG